MKEHIPLLSTVEKAAQDGLREGLKEVLKRSRENSPEDAGDLKKEGRVNIDDLTGQVYYTSLVARLQHENLEYHHDDGGPKFLENALAEVGVEKHIAERIRGALS